MRRLGIILVVALATGALASTAMAELPEIGRCVKQATKTAVYRSANCVVKSEGEATGAYEWLPGPGPNSGLVVEGGATQFVGVAGRGVEQKLTCFIYTTGSGVVTSSGLSLPSGVSWSECELYNGSNWFKCKASQQPGEVIRTAALDGTLGIVKGTTAGLDLSPTAAGEPFFTIHCPGNGDTSLTGSVIGKIAGANKMTTSIELGFHPTFTGKQKVTKFFGGEPDVLAWHENGQEQPGALDMGVHLKFEEPLEVKTAA